MILRQELLNPADFVEDHPLFINGEQVGKTQERAVGWHASELVKGAATQAGLMEEYEGEFAWNWDMLLGLGVEAFFIRKRGITSVGGTIWQIGEMAIPTGLTGKSKDGRSLCTVYANTDGYSPEVEWAGGKASGKGQVSKHVGRIVPVLEEFKSTEKSLAKDPAKQFYWHMQMKTYLKAKQLKFGSAHRWARLWCLWLCGDYGKDWGGPMIIGKKKVMTCWWIEYTQQEIDNNWWVLMEWLKSQKA